MAHLEAAGEAEGELCGVLEGAREVAEGARQVQLGQIRHCWRLKVIAALGREEGVSKRTYSIVTCPPGMLGLGKRVHGNHTAACPVLSLLPLNAKQTAERLLAALEYCA